jgi:hypothetical protein
MEPSTDRPDAEAAEFIERCHRALRQHTGGNPRPYLELWSHADDVSLMGGVGGHQTHPADRRRDGGNVAKGDDRLPSRVWRLEGDPSPRRRSHDS